MAKIEITSSENRIHINNVDGGRSLTLNRTISDGGVYIDGRDYRRSTDHTRFYNDLSGAAVWALIHDTVADPPKFSPNF